MEARDQSYLFPCAVYDSYTDFHVRNSIRPGQVVLRSRPFASPLSRQNITSLDQRGGDELFQRQCKWVHLKGASRIEQHPLIAIAKQIGQPDQTLFEG